MKHSQLHPLDEATALEIARGVDQFTFDVPKLPERPPKPTDEGDRGAVIVGDEAPVWTFADEAEGPDDDSIEAQADHGTASEPDPPLQQVVQRRWTSMRTGPGSSAGQPSSDKSASEEADNRFRGEPPERGPAGRRKWPRARSSCRTRCMTGLARTAS